MPQALVCGKCKEPFVFTGAGMELSDDSRLVYKHSCGAVNELEFMQTDQRGQALYRTVGLIRDMSYASPTRQAPPTHPAMSP